MEQNKYKVFKLSGKVQHYAWGGHSYLPGLLSVPNLEGKPFAEYWLGAHDNAPAELMMEPKAGIEPMAAPAGKGSELIPLSKYIQAFPEATLGAYTAEKFGRLPYLLKILDVRDMLSIQVHPSRENARLEFAEENNKGIPLNAPHRNYKDDNHKPELMVALSEFWLLHGFKPAAELKRILHAIPELRFLAPVFERGGYKDLYKTVMEMEQGEVNQALQPLLDRIIPLYLAHKLDKGHEDFWAARAALTFNEAGRIDRGIFSIYLFNLLNLHPGEAIFQDAGLPHAYLEGQNVEIMANSDNVLRGGLTPKHIDVPELLKHVVFAETTPRIITGTSGDGHIAIFHTPAPDFELARISLVPGESIIPVNRSTGIFIVLEGQVQVGELDPEGFGKSGPGSGKEIQAFDRKKGEAFLAFNKANMRLTGQKDTVVYWASVPVTV